MGPQWRMLLGAEYDRTRHFFRSQAKFALSYCHPDSTGLPYRVMIESPERIVGISDETQERINLNAADLVLHELDRPTLCRAVATAFGLKSDPAPVESLSWTERLGYYLPVVGRRFPTYLSICSQAADFQNVVTRLAAKNGPFLLLAPTGRYVTPVVQTVIRQSHAGFLPLGETLAMDQASRLVATPAATALLEQFADTAIPAAGAIPTELPTNEFRRFGKLWQIRFAGTTIGLKDYLGLGYIVQLIAHPNEQIFCAKLFAAAHGHGQRVAVGSCGAILDAEALSAYQRWVVELGEELAEAQSHHDFGRQETLQMELDLLTAEVGAALGLGGRHRERSDVERFRKSVTMAITRAVEAIIVIHPALGGHLTDAITTGRFCSYSPKCPVDWVV